MTIPTPTFVFVPGLLHTPDHFETIISSLAKRGAPAVAVRVKGVGADATTAAPLEDVKSIRDAVSQQVQDGGQVILVAHSHGGVAASQVLRDTPGIIGAIFLAALLIKDGETALGTMIRLQTSKAPAFGFDPHNYKQLVPLERAGHVFFGDLDAAAQAHWAGKLKPASVAQNTVVIPASTWENKVPKVYIFTKGEDRAVPFYSQWAMLNEVDDGSWSTAEIESGHSPFLSHVEQLCDILANFASRLQEDEDY